MGEKNMFFVIPGMPSKTFDMVSKYFLITLSVFIYDCGRYGRFIVSQMGPTTPLPLLVAHFGQIRDTIISTVAATNE